jgi:hypothetical protein
MFKQLSYRKRIKLFPVGFLIAFLLIYLLAIRETLKIKKECKELAGQTNAAKDAPRQMAQIQNKLNELNNIMGKGDKESDSDPLLEFVSSSNSSGTSLVDFQPLHVYQHQNYQVETRTAVFEGSYINLLKFLHAVEKGFKSGKVVSVKFQTETNLKTERKRLLMSLFIQSVKNETADNAQPQSKQ